jgi:hypothetical protein
MRHDSVSAFSQANQQKTQTPSLHPKNQTKKTQKAMLYYGAYASQKVIRAAGGGTQQDGQLLLPYDPTNWDVDGAGRNLLLAAGALKLDAEWFPSRDPASQPTEMLTWAKRRIVAGVPVIFAAYVKDCGRAGAETCDESYDHIMPATGVCSDSPLTANAPAYDTDTLTIAGLFTRKAATRDFASLPAGPTHTQPDGCEWQSYLGGCIPDGTNFAVSVTGIKDAGKTSARVQLYVNKNSEPDVVSGRKPTSLKGTVVVKGLKPGSRNLVLRYEAVKDVPTTGDAAAFFASPYSSSYEFVAPADGTFTWRDPTKIPSDGVAYYRCIACPDSGCPGAKRQG